MLWLVVVLGVLFVASVGFGVLKYHRRAVVVMPISPAPGLGELKKGKIDVIEKASISSDAQVVKGGEHLALDIHSSPKLEPIADDNSSTASSRTDSETSKRLTGSNKNKTSGTGAVVGAGSAASSSGGAAEGVGSSEVSRQQERGVIEGRDLEMKAKMILITGEVAATRHRGSINRREGVARDRLLERLQARMKPAAKPVAESVAQKEEESGGVKASDEQDKHADGGNGSVQQVSISLDLLDINGGMNSPFEDKDGSVIAPDDEGEGGADADFEDNIVDEIQVGEETDVILTKKKKKKLIKRIRVK
jgi:hypothetical protein